MIRKRMLPILFPFFLLVACRSPSIDPGLVIDVAEQAPAIVTAVVKSLTPTPTSDPRPAIKAYFVFASSPSCEAVSDKVNETDPSRSILCYDNDVTVRYDEWTNTDTMDDVHQNFLAASTDKIEDTWNDGDPDKPLGKFYAFIDSEGRANIIWTATYSGLQTILDGTLSGWAFRTDGDYKALYEWWSKTGSAHN